MIDLAGRRNPTSVKLHQYEQSLGAFLAYFGKVVVPKVDIQFHVGEPSKLYNGHDFAVGQTTWADARGEQHVTQERWVRQGRSSYTRSVGFVTPRSPGKSLTRPDTMPTSTGA